jgi:hypothetical protein
MRNEGERLRMHPRGFGVAGVKLRLARVRAEHDQCQQEEHARW